MCKFWVNGAKEKILGDWWVVLNLIWSRDNNTEQSAGDWKEETHEIMVIASANTVIDPRTVMIKTLHASVANAAMPRSCCSNDFTVWAEQDWIKSWQHILIGIKIVILTMNGTFLGDFKYPGSLHWLRKKVTREISIKARFTSNHPMFPCTI